jgi:hypothetical protein
MKCSRCGQAVGPWVKLDAMAKAWKKDREVVIDIRELRAALCLFCARDLRSWLGIPRTGMTEGG